MTLNQSLIAGAVSLAGTAALVPAAMVYLRRSDVVDVPGPRSSHTETTLRGGGIAMLLPVIAVYMLAMPSESFRTYVGLVGLAGFAVLGFFDDLVGGLSVKLRLFGQVAFGVVLAGSVVDSPVLVLLGALYAVALVNSFNFMDGINGISGATATISGVSYALMGWYSNDPALTSLGIAAAGAGLGFLPYNFPKPLVFLGDVGSYFLGGLVAFCGLLALNAGIPPILVLAPLAIYATDTSSTLVLRIVKRNKWSDAHRDHAYQRLASAKSSHPFATTFVAMFSAACVGAGSIALYGNSAQLVAAVLLVAFGASYVTLANYLEAEEILAAELQAGVKALNERAQADRVETSMPTTTVPQRQLAQDNYPADNPLDDHQSMQDARSTLVAAALSDQREKHQ